MTERQQIVAYTTLIVRSAIKTLTTCQLLGNILAETEQHASELADYLKLRSEVR